MRAYSHLSLLLAAVLMSACGQSMPPMVSEPPPAPAAPATAADTRTLDAKPQTSRRNLSQIRSSGELRVLTRNAPTTYYLDRDEQAAGPEYELVSAFAAALGVKARFVVKETLADILDSLSRGDADMAAAGLTATDDREQRFLFSEPTRHTTQQLVCRRRGTVARDVAALSKVKLEVIADSAYEATLTALRQQLPELVWQRNHDIGTEQLLQKVWQRDTDCTIADSNIVDVNRRLLPELIVMFDISPPQAQGWALPATASELLVEANHWLRSKAGREVLSDVDERYYGHIDTFDYVDTRALLRRADERLPQYRKLFEQAARRHNLDPQLLAAQAYQESHWDPAARSPTGVRGLMMLTRDTADSLGVADRLDPAQSIAAGARYLAKLRKRFRAEIGEPDRTYMALAAYNVGRAHMHDAQLLARRLGKDPHSWADLREVLPLLSNPRYYKTLKYGYARGLEPVRYVQRIRNYQDILAARDNPNLPVLARKD